MAVLQITLLAAFAWVAVLGLVLALCSMAGRADRAHDELTNLVLSAPGSAPEPVVPPRGLACSGRAPAAGGVSLGV